jgi:hypothetical protein
VHFISPRCLYEVIIELRGILNDADAFVYFVFYICVPLAGGSFVALYLGSALKNLLVVHGHITYIHN